ncbi:MAG: D-glycero-beta-D-manno-heptose 1,7-bisphosphate 7-phosphatase [Pseudomonadales bacterium]|nr:D-glycero-beta-D-manno-heptose 1,7-bisphosphate 7-phosphatase [Pseudomonadales bacterium]
MIVLDRDGVLNIDSPDYIKSAEEWIPIPGSIEAVASLSRAGYRIYVATNQAGLAKGKFVQKDLDEMHQKLESLVEAAGGVLTGIFYCPHHPDENCECRKPRPGLLLNIASSAGVKPETLIFIGDSTKDVMAARAVGAKPVLVLTGNGQQSLQSLSDDPPETHRDLASFARSLLRSE